MIRAFVPAVSAFFMAALLWSPVAQAGTNLWIYAIIMGDRRESWTISASLIYDVETDSSMGTWAGTGREEDGNEFTCSRP